MYPKIVCIGGGTGFQSFKGFKTLYRWHYCDCDCSDDGGSSGIIRNELKIRLLGYSKLPFSLSLY